jgi:hypothetical protein
MYSRQSPSDHLSTIRKSLLAEFPRDSHENYLIEMDSQLTVLSSHSPNASILQQKNAPETFQDVFALVFEELRTRVPFLFKVLNFACFSFTGTLRNERIICLLYAIIMRARNKGNDMLQRMLTAVCLRHHASNEVDSS